ncbi:MAG: efflux RND transporter periplasmic adaptor subunit [Nitrospirota bacterium]
MEVKYGAKLFILAGALSLLIFSGSGCNRGTSDANATQTPGNPLAANTVTLDSIQLKSVKIEPAGQYLFRSEREAVGNIAFNDDRSVQVYPSYQGKIIEMFCDLGDNVSKGKKLYTVNSPDLVQAESTLIADAGVLDLDAKVLERARKLYETQGIAQKELQQAISDQQTAEAALKAARDAVGIFGKTEAEIDQIVAKRRIDPVMVVYSPITGRITARNAAPGLLVQPGNAPAPCTVVDISTMWMVAYVPESDSPLFHVGQDVKVKLMALPGRTFEGKITTVGATVDPVTHRLMVRSEIHDPRHELKPGMFATFSICTGKPVRSVAVPVNGVVREGDGTMIVWVTTDRRSFIRRTVKLGLQQDGCHQILGGLRPGELVVTDGAIFLSNILESSDSSD